MNPKKLRQLSTKYRRETSRMFSKVLTASFNGETRLEQLVKDAQNIVNNIIITQDMISNGKIPAFLGKNTYQTLNQRLVEEVNGLTDFSFSGLEAVKNNLRVYLKSAKSRLPSSAAYLVHFSNFLNTVSANRSDNGSKAVLLNDLESVFWEYSEGWTKEAISVQDFLDNMNQGLITVKIIKKVKAGKAYVDSFKAAHLEYVSLYLLVSL